MGWFEDIMDPFGLYETKTEEPRVERVETLSPEQKNLLQFLNERMPGLFDQPGPQPSFSLSPGTGPAGQSYLGAARGLAPQGAAAMGRMADPTQNMQYAQQLFEPIQDQIANRFATAGGARSSGFGQALGRGFAQGVMPQVLNQQAIGAQGALGAGQSAAGMENLMRQQDIRGQLQKWQMGLPGSDPRTRWMSTSLGVPAFGNIGLPGYQEPSMMSQFSQVIGPAMMAMSDRSVKKNVEPMNDALGKVRKLKGYSFNYIGTEDSNRNGGVMAQDLEQVLPDAVSDINGVKYVRYDAVIGLLVNAVNELQEKVG